MSAREGFRKDGIGDAEFHTVVVCILAQAERKAGGASGEASLGAPLAARGVYDSVGIILDHPAFLSSTPAPHTP